MNVFISFNCYDYPMTVITLSFIYYHGYISYNYHYIIIIFIIMLTNDDGAAMMILVIMIV